jgi:hypothetical protein
MARDIEIGQRSAATANGSAAKTPSLESACRHLGIWYSPSGNGISRVVQNCC